MDMVTMNIIDSTMVSICREMGITMMKTSYSTIFNEGLDFTCGLGNTRGELIGVAEFNPSQIGGLPRSHEGLDSEPKQYVARENARAFFPSGSGFHRGLRRPSGP